MSMEVHVLFRDKLPSKAALTRAMRELGFPCTITEKGSLEQQDGYMPVRVRSEESGVEFDVFDGRAAVEEIAGADVDARFDRSANFRWGGDEDEMLAGLCASAALAQLLKGIVLNDSDDRPQTADEAIADARKHLESAAKPVRHQLGTRPADIKRYLKPLLEQRDDLALVGRRLVIRPVRHLLRGALLDRTGDKYTFQVWSYLYPLHKPEYAASSVGYGDRIHDGRFKVWQPHFAPLLFDSLAEDILGPMGRMTTLEDFAAWLSRNPQCIFTQITSLVLAGKHQQAADYVRAAARGEVAWPYSRGVIENLQQFLHRDIASVCAEFHAKEAETVRALKLEHIWEPSPFPVELAACERASRSDEPAFSLSFPRPPGLLQELPEGPGELRFAKEFMRRDGVTPLLVVVLTPEQAEERHRQFEQYILAARLPDGLRLMISRHGGWDRHDPQRAERLERMRRTSGQDQPDPWPLTPSFGPPFMALHIELRGTSHRLTAEASEFRLGQGRMQFSYINVHEQDGRQSSWQCFFDPREGEKDIHDSRTGEEVYTKPALTPIERELLTFPTPAFGEYAELVTRLRTLLQAAGYGEIG